MPSFARDGLRLSYADAGADAGEPFVFQHGLGGDAAQPASQAPAGRRLITLECRGHGASELGPEAALGFETFARDLDALLDALALEQVVVGGISMGAGVALALARLSPRRVRALVLVRPAWLDRAWPRNLHAFGEIAALLREHGPEEGKARFAAESREHRRIAAISPAAAQSLLGQFDRPGAQARAAVLERLPADRPIGPADDWSALSMPALVIGARGDGIHPYHCAVALSERLPRATLCEVPAKEHGDAAHRRAVATAIERLLADGPDRAVAPPAGVGPAG
jgi:pimeloyl-ACP methyl ester carboxylesterase